ncbi:hypothetical protein HA402_002604 [Bradysia odoriphaga]|nr:hypothetical protein HA402_002604 [Bradysia odoriphaga]
MNFQNLNEDCVRHIFQFLHLDDLYAMSNVSKHFRDNVNKTKLKRKCVLTVDTPTAYNKIRKFLRRVGHHIETIKIVEIQRESHNLSYVYQVTQLLQSYCYNVKHLRIEHFAGIRLTDFEQHFDLQTLELENSSLCSSMVLSASQQHDFNMTINALTLNTCTSGDILILLDYLKMNPKLRHLRLLNCCLCANETMTGLFNDVIISSLQHLQCLTLDYSVKCTNLQLIADLPNLRKLFLLHFNENKLTKLFDCYANKEQCRLQEIHFHMCTISNNSIYESLSKIKSLEVLEMCKNFGMTSNHLNIMSACKKLTHLRCFDCIQLINDEGICNLVGNCDKLRMLAVYWCTGVTLETVDRIEHINKLTGRPHFTFKIGGRTGINWNDSGPVPSISKIDRSTDTFTFEATNENITCQTHRHNCSSWPDFPSDH